MKLSFRRREKSIQLVAIFNTLMVGTYLAWVYQIKPLKQDGHELLSNVFLEQSLDALFYLSLFLNLVLNFKDPGKVAKVFPKSARL